MEKYLSICPVPVLLQACTLINVRDNRRIFSMTQHAWSFSYSNNTLNHCYKVKLRKCLLLTKHKIIYWIIRFCQILDLEFFFQLTKEEKFFTVIDSKNKKNFYYMHMQVCDKKTQLTSSSSNQLFSPKSLWYYSQ